MANTYLLIEINFRSETTKNRITIGFGQCLVGVFHYSNSMPHQSRSAMAFKCRSISAESIEIGFVESRFATNTSTSLDFMSIPSECCRLSNAS